LLSCSQDEKQMLLMQMVAGELAIPPSDNELREWLREAQRVVDHDAFVHIFSAGDDSLCYCEVPLLYRNGDGDTVHGIIDRLVITPAEILVVDYKTHRSATPANIPLLGEEYREQLRLYTEGVQQLWPGKPVRSFLLFTSALTLYELT